MLFGGEFFELDAFTQEFGGVLDNLEWAEERRLVIDGVFVGVVDGRVAVLTVEELVGITEDKLNRGRCEPDLEGIEVAENVAIAVVDRTM